MKSLRVVSSTEKQIGFCYSLLIVYSISISYYFSACFFKNIFTYISFIISFPCSMYMLLYTPFFITFLSYLGIFMLCNSDAYKMCLLNCYLNIYDY